MLPKICLLSSKLSVLYTQFTMYAKKAERQTCFFQELHPYPDKSVATKNVERGDVLCLDLHIWDLYSWSPRVPYYLRIPVCLSVYIQVYTYTCICICNPYIKIYIHSETHIAFNLYCFPFLILSLYFVYLLALYSKGKSKRYVIKTLLSF